MLQCNSIVSIFQCCQTMVRHWTNLVRHWLDIGPILTGVTPQMLAQYHFQYWPNTGYTYWSNIMCCLGCILRLMLSMLKPGFNYPSWRVTGFHYRVDGRAFPMLISDCLASLLVIVIHNEGKLHTGTKLTGRVDSTSGNGRPSARPVLTGNGNRSPVNSGR